MSEKEWLKSNRSYVDLDEQQLTSIFYFPLIWNIFEKELCNKNAKIGTHPDNISSDYAALIDSEVLSGVFSHFKKRYIRDGKATSLFKNFEFKTPSTIKGETFDILNSSDCATLQLKALLYIAFRLRNNLYHGEKEVNKLYEQNENFKQINLLLMALIDKKIIEQ